MRIKSLAYFVCPKCDGGKLNPVVNRSDDTGEEVLEGCLQCAICNIDLPISAGIPRFVATEDYTKTFGFQWNIHQKTQLDSHTDFPISRERLFQVTAWPRNLKGQNVLEAGSGAGRFTEVLIATGAEIFSFDYSEAVEANWANNGKKANLNLFQADIFHIPLRKATFDKVICLGVIQHTPNPELAFKSLAQYVRPGGEIAIDVYSRRLLSLVSWKYLLRPLTKRIKKERLYRIIQRAVPILIPMATLFRRSLGKIGARMLPIIEYSYLGLPPNLNKQWAILDTFDMYSPAYDHPVSVKTVKRWFSEAGFIDSVVVYGPNGIIGRGIREIK